MPAGRPTKLTEEVRETVASMVRAGNYLETAAAYAGVDERSVQRWRRRGQAEIRRVGQNARYQIRQSEEPFVEFANAVDKALAYAEINDLNLIRMAAETEWRAAAWRLERRHPERWGGKQTVSVDAEIRSEVEHKYRYRPDLSRLTEEELAVLEKAMARTDDESDSAAQARARARGE